jgi:hypothetical protein
VGGTAIVIGLALLIEALRGRCWVWALAAGLAAGAAEWFRSGTLLLFAVPCGFYALAFLVRRDWGRLGRAGVALAALFLAAVAAGRAVPSPVNKTLVNLRHHLAENEGPFHTETIAGLGEAAYSMAGYRLTAGGDAVVNDDTVRQARGRGTADFVVENADVLGPLYLAQLRSLLDGPALGLRWVMGTAAVWLFLYQVLVACRRRDAEAVHTLAWAAGALAYYLGPVVFLRGDSPTHYLLLAFPLVLLIAARGAVTLAAGVVALGGQRLPNLSALRERRRGFVLAIIFAPAAILNATFYWHTVTQLAEDRQRTAREQAALDALHLEGRTVVCRNMAWFVDRDVRTVLLPYARVDRLGRYVRAQGADGILVWEAETQVHFRAMPYGSVQELDRALRKSPVFASPQVSGDWRWYPVRRTAFSQREP